MLAFLCNVISVIKTISSQRAIPVPSGMLFRPTSSKATGWNELQLMKPGTSATGDRSKIYL